MKSIDRLVWVDLETTGLDIEGGMILEVALVITDRDLKELAAESWIIRPHDGLPALHRVVLDMHGRNGLLGRLHNGKKIAEVDAMAAGMVYAAGAGGGPIAGASAHFDKMWIDRYMPLLAKCFNHRVYDVSTLKQGWCLAHGQEWKDETATAHRALDDIRDSIAIARECLVTRMVDQ